MTRATAPMLAALAIAALGAAAQTRSAAAQPAARPPAKPAPAATPAATPPAKPAPAATPRSPFASAPAAAPAPARHRVVLAPLATLGAESSSAEVRASQRLVARGLGALATVDLVPQAAMLDAIKRARRPELRACDGEPACLAQLGSLLRADLAIYGEVGGLGGAHVIYLKLVDARTAVEIRSTVLELGAGATSGTAAETEARAAATRLLTPERYIGRLQLDVRVRGASIFIDGRLAARAPVRPLLLAVGSHALRVTHPEFRDFVRFVEVPFDASLRVPVDLRPYRAVAGDIRRTDLPPPRPLGPDPGALPTPWYRRWYTITGAGALLLVGSAVAVGLASGGLTFDLERDL